MAHKQLHPSDEICIALLQGDDLPDQVKADALAHIKVCSDCSWLCDSLTDVYDNRETDEEARNAYGDL